MRIGVNILNFGPGAAPDTLLRWAQVSEALGYHSVMISDHVAITPSVATRYPEPYYDTFATLAWLAGQTTRVQLGTTVVVLPYRHAVLTARLVANIDQFSGGRFIFGIGVGNALDEFQVLGADHPRRGTASDDALRAMIALWNADAPVSFKGRLSSFDDVSPIATTQKPHPPIWVGGNTEKALRRAVRYGDAWHPILMRGLTIAAVAESLVNLTALADAAGRETPLFCPRIRLDLRNEDQPEGREAGSGSIEQVRQDLEALQKLGAQHVTLDWFTGDLEATRNHERGWRMLAVLAEQVFDLKNETLR